MQAVDAKQLIGQLFEDACFELFEAMQCDTQLLIEQQALRDDTPAAYIDAGSDDFELLITLKMPFPALNMTYPMLEQALDIDEQELEDWILELANRLLGILKSKLMLRHCTIKTGLPTADAALDTGQTGNQQTDFPFQFLVDDERVETGIRIEALASTIDIAAEVEVPNHTVQSGELDFF